MEESAPKKVFFLLASVLFLSGCSAENEIGPEDFVSQSDGIHKLSAFSNFSIYLSTLDDTYNYLSSSSNVSEKCRVESREILLKARSGDVDALKFLDATGKPSSGILEGGIFFLGFYSECVNSVVKISNISNTHHIEGQYCLVNLKFDGLVRPEAIPEVSWFVLNQKTKSPTVGICIPSSCSTTDLSLSVLAGLSHKFENATNDVLVCHRDPSGFSTDVGALCILCVLVIFISISVVATVADVIQENNKFVNDVNSTVTDNAKSISREILCEVVEPKPPNLFMECLLAFSLKRNIKKVFVVEEGRESIKGVHGLKFFSMTLIILGHSFTFGTQNLFFRNPGAAVQAPKDFLSQIFANGTLAVDTFYVISGVLVACVTLKVLDVRQGKLPILYFYLHRYFRLTPLMMMVTLISAYLLRYVGSGPNWLSSIKMYDEWCRKNAWINALYLHNFIDTEHMCLSHTWYLATDMQFYLIVPLIIIPLHKNPRWGYAISFLFLLITCVTTGVITKINHYPAIPYINNVMNETLVNDYYRDVYIKPYCRLGPYIIGILLGYMLHQKKEFTMNKVMVVIGWLSSITFGLLVIYLMWPANQGYLPTDDEAAAYSSLARTVWAVCLAWLLFACNYGYSGFINNILSWTPIIPLSRLTYCAYLIHPLVMNTFYGSMQTTVDFSLSYMMYLFLGNICITFFLSIFLSALFEAPFIVLEKVLLSKKSS